MTLRFPLFGWNKAKHVIDLISYNPMHFTVRTPCRECGTTTQGALSVNGINYPSCCAASCNKAIIDMRLGGREPRIAEEEGHGR